MRKTVYCFGLALVIPLFSACSLAFVNGPPVGYERFDPVPCTSSKLFPIVDAVWSAASFWAGGMLALEDEDAGFQDEANKYLGVSETGIMVTMIASGLASGYSAYKGFKDTKSCRDAVLEVEARNRDGIAESQGRSLDASDSAWQDPFLPTPRFLGEPLIVPRPIP